MPRHVAFLRAINTGGRRVTNAQLAQAVTAAGLTDVGTFLASGNVFYEAGPQDPAAEEELLEEALRTHLGFTSEAFVRTVQDLEAILAAEPFAATDVAAAATKVQIAFLREELDQTTSEAVHELATADDKLQVIGRELHWLPMTGVGRADLDWRRLDPLLGVATVRSINTVRRILPKLA